ncbi:glycerate kinase [Planctomycetota bacterium]|nr:glycerate kinase [Planctomycetota bacterium]
MVRTKRAAYFIYNAAPVSVRVLCAPDKFKHAVSANEAANALKLGVLAACPDALVQPLPLADGGEGTLQALSGEFPDVQECYVQDPLGREIRANFALSDDGQSALIETAQSNGLWRLTPTESNPRRTHTFGVGQLIQHALGAGARHILLGLGGSATHDGGAGMAVALGAKFIDEHGHALPPAPDSLMRLASIDLSGLDSRMASTEFVALCDVGTAMLDSEHESGAIQFAAQKGAKLDDIPVLDSALQKLALAVTQVGIPVDGNQEFTGVAGGLGFGAAVFLGAELIAGAEAVLESCKVADHVKDCDLVLTGEGSYDAQTANGKLIAALGKLCQEADVPLIVLAGKVAPDISIAGVTEAININPQGQESLADTSNNLTQAAAQVVQRFVR